MKNRCKLIHYIIIYKIFSVKLPVGKIKGAIYYAGANQVRRQSLNNSPVL